MIIKPKALPYGGTVGITAPSSQIDARATADYIKIVEDMGFKVVIGKTITNVFDEGYTAASPEFRGKELNAMFADDDIDAVIAAAGGYGAQEVVPYLDMDMIKESRKPFIGFSDTTFILNAITGTTGLITFLGPTGETYDAKLDKAAIELSYEFMTGSHEFPRAVKNLTNRIVRRLVPKKSVVEGRLYGGNIAMTESLIGTPWCLKGKAEDPIFLFEEVGESSYEVSRIFLHLAQAGYFENAKGLVFGDFTSITHEKIEEPYNSVPSIYEALRSYVANLDLPALVGYDFSHGEQNLTWPIGARAILDSDARAVVLLENPVETK